MGPNFYQQSLRLIASVIVTVFSVSDFLAGHDFSQNS